MKRWILLWTDVLFYEKMDSVVERLIHNNHNIQTSNCLPKLAIFSTDEVSCIRYVE